EPDQDLSGADIAVVLGGDGTMLRALQRFLGTEVPVIGVNFGRVGFLASIQQNELESGLARVFSGDYRVVQLATLEVETAGTRGRWSSRAGSTSRSGTGRPTFPPRCSSTATRSRTRRSASRSRSGSARSGRCWRRCRRRRSSAAIARPSALSASARKLRFRAG